MSAICKHCHDKKLVGWSGAGPHFCRHCCSNVERHDAFTVISSAWIEQRNRALSAEADAAYLRGEIEKLKAGAK